MQSLKLLAFLVLSFSLQAFAGGYQLAASSQPLQFLPVGTVVKFSRDYPLPASSRLQPVGPVVFQGGVSSFPWNGCSLVYDGSEINRVVAKNQELKVYEVDHDPGNWVIVRMTTAGNAHFQITCLLIPRLITSNLLVVGAIDLPAYFWIPDAVPVP